MAKRTTLDEEARKRVASRVRASVEKRKSSAGTRKPAVDQGTLRRKASVANARRAARKARASRNNGRPAPEWAAPKESQSRGGRGGQKSSSRALVPSSKAVSSPRSSSSRALVPSSSKAVSSPRSSSSRALVPVSKPAKKPGLGRKLLRAAGGLSRLAGATGLALHSRPAGKGSDKPKGGLVPHPGTPTRSKPKTSDHSRKVNARADRMEDRGHSRKVNARADRMEDRGHSRKVNARADRMEAKTGKVSTKSGSYPVYKRDSAPAGDFRSAFAAARKAGKKEFTWNGRKYNTKTK